MYRDDSVIRIIREKDISLIRNVFFTYNRGVYISENYKTETQLWDYKKQFPELTNNLEWAELSKDVLAMHNSRQGGILLFGIEDGTFDIVGISSDRKIDSKLVNDKLRTYLGDRIWIEYYSIVLSNDIIIGIIIIPPYSGEDLVRFVRNGPEKRKRSIFLKDGSSIRKNDSSIVMSPIEASRFSFSDESGFVGQYEIDEPRYKLLARDYNEFVYRNEYCSKIIDAINRNRVSTVTITGIGGMGKTALATWAARYFYHHEKFAYIVSVSAKDRELTQAGIQAMLQKFTCFDDLLNAILEIIELNDWSPSDIIEKEQVVRELITNSNMLIVLDNLETIGDVQKVIEFINDLPDGVKAIVTSRRNLLDVSIYPINVGGLEDGEIVHFIDGLAKTRGYEYCMKLGVAEKQQLGVNCSRIPLAIKWIISRCNNVDELLQLSESITKNAEDNDQLMEFVFRRIVDKMSQCEKRIVKVLSIAPNLSIEELALGCDILSPEIIDGLRMLIRDTIVTRSYDKDISDYRYSLLDITRNFVRCNCISRQEEREISQRLRDYYDAIDVSDPEERRICCQARQSGKNQAETMINMAISALPNNPEAAKQLFDSAVRREPNNWKVRFAYANHYYKGYLYQSANALSECRRAIACAPDDYKDPAVARLYRETGMLISKSAERNATDEAISHLKKAQIGLPNDPITAGFLARMYIKKQLFENAIQTLLPFRNTTISRTQQELWPLLNEAYDGVKPKYQLEQVQLTDEMQKYEVYKKVI